MNRSRILLGVNPGKWRQLLPVGAAGQCCQGESLLPVGVSQIQKTRPLSLSVNNNTAHCSKHSRCYPITSDQHRENASTWLMPQTQSSDGKLRGGKPSPSPTQLCTAGSERQGNRCFLDAAARGLSRGHTACVKTLVRGFHTTGTGTARERRMTDAPLTEASETGAPSQQRKEDHQDDGRSRSSEAPADEAWTLETEEDVERLSQEILKEAGQRDVMVRSVPLSQVAPLVLGLHESGGWTPSVILHLLSTRPSLLLHPQRRSLLPTIHHLLSLGFDSRQVRAVVENLPAVLQTPASQITQVVDALRDLGFGGQNLFRVASTHPPLLLASRAALSERVTSLRQLFKSADVVTLAGKCPRLLTDPWREVKARFDYAFHEMGVSQKQMVHAALFNHSLSAIRQRHTFLVRAGLFSTAKRREGERSPNATLDWIVATSDREFCRRFGGFGVAEYRSFCRLYDKEQAVLDSLDSDSDSDSDDENSKGK